MQVTKDAAELKGRITKACLDEVLKFAREASLGENRRVFPIISVKHPREEHSNDFGIAFGLYGDYLGAIKRVFLAEAGGEQFCIYLPLAEVWLIADGVFWLHRGDMDTIYLTERGNFKNQGECIDFFASWIEQID